MTKTTTLKICLLTATIALAGCSGDNDVKSKLGLRATPPDEFSVVTRAPLAVPPDFTLRPPRPGADRPMELSVRQQTRQTVFGIESTQAPTGDTASSDFMSKLGTTQADPNIRESLNSEMVKMDKQEQPAAEKLLFWKQKEPRGKTIDPIEEQKRLQAQSTTTTTTTSTSVQKRNEDILETP